MNLYVDHDQQAARRVVRVAGEVDMSNAAELLDFLLDLNSSARQDLTLDLSGIQFIDSSGLGVLIEIHKILAEQGQRLEIREPSSQADRTLQISGLDRVLTIVKSQNLTAT